MNIQELSQVFKIIKTNNIDNDIIFDYFRVVKYNNDIDIDKHNNVLFFPITIKEEELKDGWYNVSLDLRDKIADIEKNNPNYILVIEPFMKDLVSSKCKYIMVDNIMECVSKLADYKLNKFKGKIIAVTGSVGKTTTVGFIKQVLGDKCIRIYSKRITPLVLDCFLINYLNNDYDYFVIETSLWFKEHITYFSKRLKPDLAILLNVYPEHIGVGDIKTISDVAKFKSLLLEYANNVLINYTDNELKKIDIRDNYVYYNNELVVKTNVNNIIKIDKMNSDIEPYIKTKLTMLQETIAYEVGKYYKLDEKLILERLKNIKPVEHRVNKEKIYNHEIIFDGDVSGVARLNNFFDHYYDKAYLIIINLVEGGEEEEDYTKLEKTFTNFEKVYINKKFSKYFKDDNIIYIDNLNFIRALENDVTLFVHCGSYYRKYDEFNIKNLEEYL